MVNELGHRLFLQQCLSSGSHHGYLTPYWLADSTSLLITDQS